MNRQKHEKAGRRAEILASWFLRLRGYRILSRRIKTGVGEIDIAASKGNTLVVVEVKHRPDRQSAEDSLKTGTWRRIHDAAQIFQTRSPALRNMAVRYDAIFVTGRWGLIHRPDIWRPD
ncbi:MAG: YraN family protein [Hyphomonadaceae bacterium]|nr:YraN family protein [Hyphomonadaceae bacterium]MBC6413274.1 YraN family protein [Hyphomonadaceae bacterium]